MVSDFMVSLQRACSINHFHGWNWQYRICSNGIWEWQWWQWGAANYAGASKSAGWIWSIKQDKGTGVPSEDNRTNRGELCIVWTQLFMLLSTFSDLCFNRFWWLQIGLTFWIKLSFGQDELTGKLNFQIPMKMYVTFWLVLIFRFLVLFHIEWCSE